MNATRSKADTIQETIARIRTMREYTRRSGFKTTRSQNELLSRLKADDLADVLLALEGHEYAPNK